MALGNTFGATTFCSFGAYWITFATLSEIDSTNIAAETVAGACRAEILMGIFMMVLYLFHVRKIHILIPKQAWFIFTTLMLLCTLKSSIVMFLIFFFLDLNYLLLGITHFQYDSSSGMVAAVQKAGGICGILAAITAWYNAFAGVFDQSNGFFTVPLGHFPWSPVHHAQQANKYEEV
jgi:succinate-acetate transporter protein